MKILHIIDSGGLYGAEMVLLNLVAEQIKMGLHPTIASIGEKHIGEKPLEAEALKRGFKVEKFRMRPGPNYLGAWKILRFAHKEEFDLLHSHGYKGNILFGFMPKRIRRLPLAATLHGWTSTNSLTKMSIYEWLDAISLRFIDSVVLVSKAMLSNPKLRNIDITKVHIVNNGIPFLDDASPAHDPNCLSSNSYSIDRTIINFCKGGYTIGSIGRLSREKGYRYLIEAIKLLIYAGLDVRLLIIGEGYERNLLENLIVQFGIRGRVMLPGYRNNASLYLPHLKVFVLSSLTEGLPITLLEAIQARIPIVATKVGGIPRVLQNGQGGLLVEPGSARSLAEVISNIHDKPKLAKNRASASYRQVVTKNTSKTMALGYMDIYKKIMNKYTI